MKVSRLGGRRPGAGRKVGSGPYGEPTKSIRLPLSFIAHVNTEFKSWAEFIGWVKNRLQTERKTQG